MDSRYFTYVIRNDRKAAWWGNGHWVKTLKNARRYYDSETASLRASNFRDTRHLHIEEAEKL